MSVLEALVAIQAELKAPKDQNAGRYRYRNIEDINEAVKPLAAKHGCAVVYTDMFTDDGVCVSTCRLIGASGDDAASFAEISADGCAYVNKLPKNMSVEQASGAASSYARKYAACGLFAIDSSERDPDRVYAEQVQAQQGKANPLKAAKHRLMDAVSAYGEKTNRTADEVMAGVKKRPQWETQKDSIEWLTSVAEEYEELANG